MSTDYCPLCHTRLEVRKVAPCVDCGHLEEEIDHALNGQHTYAEMRVFGELNIILCNFCQVDFGSYDPQFFDPQTGRDHRTLAVASVRIETSYGGLL